MLSSKTKSNQYWLSDFLCIAIFLGIFYSLWIGTNALFTPDEGRYSEVAREMVASGDYVTPRLDGVAFLDKPALYYWLQASAIYLFGIKEWALRFWPALIGVLGCLMSYITGRTLFSRRAGILSAIILATSPLYYGAAHYANLDLEVAVLIGITLMFSLLGLRAEQNKRTLFFLAAYVFAGLAFLTKGLIGIAFPTLIIGFWILILNRWSILKKMHLVIGLVIFVAITVPWYYLVQKANPEFLHFFFVTQQFSRFLTTQDFNNKAAIWFYLPVVFAGFFPWSIFVLQAVAKSLKNIWENRQAHANELFLLLWLFIIFTFFSLPKSKTVGYIIPIFPAIALLVGNYLDKLWNNAQSKGFFSCVSLFIFSSITMFITCITLWYLKPSAELTLAAPYLLITGIVFLIGGISAFVLLKKDNFAKLMYCLISVAAISLLILSASAPVLNQKTLKPIAMQLKPLLKPSDEVVTYYKFYQDLPIYLERRITIVADWNAPDIAKNDNWLRELWYGMPFQDTKDWLINEKLFWTRWHSNKKLVVFVDVNYLNNFIQQSDSTVHEISRYKDIVVVSNKA